jgi:hypothetical protein
MTTTDGHHDQAGRAQGRRVGGGRAERHAKIPMIPPASLRTIGSYVPYFVWYACDMRPNKSISLPEDLWARIDEARGDVPRSVFIERKLEGALGVVYAVTPGGREPKPVAKDRPAPPRASEEYVLPKIARRS